MTSMFYMIQQKLSRTTTQIYKCVKNKRKSSFLIWSETVPWCGVHSLPVQVHRIYSWQIAADVLPAPCTLDLQMLNSGKTLQTLSVPTWHWADDGFRSSTVHHHGLSNDKTLIKTIMHHTDITSNLVYSCIKSTISCKMHEKYVSKQKLQIWCI